MPKVFCIAGMAVAVLVLLLFLLDIALPLDWAPFKKASWMMDIPFMVAAAILGYLSWETYREQK